MNLDYQRVIPRDLFNESKLLKCIGQLALLVHDEMAPDGIVIEEPGEDGFMIGLNDEGSLQIMNMPIYIHDYIVAFKTTYNSKAPYPLYAEYNYEDIPVFDDKGQFTTSFIKFCKSFKPKKK